MGVLYWIKSESSTEPTALDAGHQHALHRQEQDKPATPRTELAPTQRARQARAEECAK